jgi:hypothetical protein
LYVFGMVLLPRWLGGEGKKFFGTMVSLLLGYRLFHEWASKRRQLNGDLRDKSAQETSIAQHKTENRSIQIDFDRCIGSVLVRSME